MLSLSLTARSFPSLQALRSRRALLIAIGLAAAAGAGAWGLRRWADNPAVPYLGREGGAEWILVDEPYRLTQRSARQREVQFRKTFTVERKPERAILTLRAFRLAAVELDGRLLRQPRSDFALWKEPELHDLAPHLAPGEHTLVIFAANENGPPAILAHAPEIGIRTDASWQSSTGGQTFSSVALASAKKPPELPSLFPTAPQALASHGWLFAAIFAVVASLALAGSRPSAERRWRRGLPAAPDLVRYALLAAWGALGANNMLKVPEKVGFDSLDHFLYIQHVAVTGAIPLAPEGWQMFQSPLYYLMSAPLLLALRPFFAPEDTIRLLRLVPLLAGAAQVEICHRTLGRLFPGRPGMRTAGTVVGGLLPMNLYLANGLGNEPLAAALGGALLACLLVAVADPTVRLTLRRAFWLGVLLGAALLAKVTAVLLVPAALAAVVWCTRREERPWWAAARAGAALLLAAAFVCGWYYARNWIALGRPFVGGWDPGRSIVWWQDPGYRVLEHFTSFGAALVQPIYAATHGLWDALYSTAWCDGYLSMMVRHDARPPWNYGLLLPCAILSLLPCAWIAAGCVSPCAKHARAWAPQVLLALGVLAVLVGAVAWLFASLPIYSTGKATYMASGTVCLAVLAAVGFDLTTRNRWARAAMAGGLAAWAVSAYGGYFVV